MTWDQAWDILKPVWGLALTILLTISAWFLHQVWTRLDGNEKRVDVVEDRMTKAEGHFDQGIRDRTRLEIDSKTRDDKLERAIRYELQGVAQWRERIEANLVTVQKENSAVLAVLDEIKSGQSQQLKAIGSLSDRVATMDQRLSRMEGTR